MQRTMKVVMGKVGKEMNILKRKKWIILGTVGVILLIGLLLWKIGFRDTKSPQIHLAEKEIFIPQGRILACCDLPIFVKDASETQLFFYQNETRTEQICFEEVGEEQICLVAEDIHGNSTTKEISVTVEYAPEIDGVKDIYATINSAIDYNEGISVIDIEDGDLTQNLTIDLANVQNNVEGVYLAHYSVRDSNGIETKIPVNVTIKTATDLQNMITKREINRNTAKIYGDVNIYDAGVSSECSVEEALQYMRPTIVQLYHQITDTKHISGSGFVMEITDDFVYICTNRHVMKDYSDWDIFFYDGTKINGISVGYSDLYDVGVVKVAVTDIPKALLENLMTVHVDVNYWRSLEGQTTEIGLLKIDREGQIEHVLSGKLLKLKEEFQWGNQQKQTEMRIDQTAGDSGSAIFDGYGNLVSMVYGTSHEEANPRNWGIPLDALVSCYEEITKR